MELPDDGQRAAAVLVGASYLVTIPLASIPEFYIPSRVYAGSAAETNRLIAAHLTLFRVGIAANVLVFTIGALQACGLYLVLRRVHRGVALVATILQLIATTLLLGIVTNDIGLARALSDPVTFGSATTWSIAHHADIYTVAHFLSGLGLTLFAWLWFRSRYVPVPLSLLGGFGFALLAVRAFLLIAAPALGRGIGMPLYGIPIFLFDVSIGVWLVASGLRT